MTSRTLTIALLGCLIFSTTSVYALQVTAGWVNADVGLQERGDGFYAGIQDSWALGTGSFDITVAGEYVQKKGSQMRFYSDPHSGLTEGEAKLNLHCLQPAAFLGYAVPMTNWKPRLYTGLSVVLNLEESWDEPQGETDGEYSYENMDLQIHLGFSLEISRFLVDARYSSGLMEQLIDGTSNAVLPNKAEEPDLPENGSKISSYQVGIGYSF